MFGEIAASPAAHQITKWLELVRKRSGQYRSSGFPHRPQRAASMPLRRLLLISFALIYSILCAFKCALKV